MNWFAAHGRAARQALLRLFGAPLNTLLSIVGIGIALALPSGGLQVLNQVAGHGGNAMKTPQFTVFLKVEGDRKTTQALADRLRERADVARVQVLLREDTLARMKTAEGLADVIGALPKNPFPDAIVVMPVDDHPEAIEKLAAEVRPWREAEHVQIDAHWARRFAALVKLARTGLLLLATLLGIGLVTITFNTIRLQVLAREREVEVSGLLGATPGFIRRPFLWHGALLGLLGGCVAWLIVAAAMLWLQAPVADLAGLYGFSLALRPPALAESAVLLGVAVALGWLGAALSMRQHLR